MKIINILAIASFGISVSLVGGTIAGYFWVTSDTTLEMIKGKVLNSLTPDLTEKVSENLPPIDVPALPNKTGGAIQM
tara:strand:+ start:1054 stop:1284 length:231 start_codon:yes stop_codon:yes gene_type:complete